MAVVSIALPRFCFEYTAVSNFPLISEQFPQQRGKVMALSFSSALLGPVVGANTGPGSYLRWGVWGLGPVSLVPILISLLLLIFLVREQPYGSATGAEQKSRP
jgi:predicted MFS family arabinose efflux permease